MRVCAQLISGTLLLRVPGNQQTCPPSGPPSGLQQVWWYVSALLKGGGSDFRVAKQANPYLRINRPLGGWGGGGWKKRGGEPKIYTANGKQMPSRELHKAHKTSPLPQVPAIQQPNHAAKLPGQSRCCGVRRNGIRPDVPLEQLTGFKSFRKGVTTGLQWGLMRCEEGCLSSELT